jgi:hypothetical protein
MALLDHTNGNGIYNTSHPLLERLVGQLEVEAACRKLDGLSIVINDINQTLTHF